MRKIKILHIFRQAINEIKSFSEVKSKPKAVARTRQQIDFTTADRKLISSLTYTVMNL